MWPGPRPRMVMAAVLVMKKSPLCCYNLCSSVASHARHVKCRGIIHDALAPSMGTGCVDEDGVCRWTQGIMNDAPTGLNGGGWWPRGMHGIVENAMTCYARIGTSITASCLMSLFNKVH